MEEIQIRDALRHHVTDNEPPMGLSAAVLVSKGRRRHWWRMGVASGGTVAAITMVGTIALVPVGGTSPLLDSAACALPVVTAFDPRPPDHPSPPPTPYPTATAYPTEDPTPYPTNDVTPYPTYEPTPHPTFEPTPNPTSYPTTDPSFFPTQDPSGNPTMAPYPTVVPTNHSTPEPSGPVPTQPPFFPPDEARMREMECYLKRELQRMVPEAKFAALPREKGPLSIYTSADLNSSYIGLDLREDGRDWDFTYLATAIIIGPDHTIRFVIMVQKLSGPPLEPEAGTTFEKRGDLIIRQFRSTGGTTSSEVQTPHSLISAHSSGPLLSPEQLIELSSATELDMFR